MMLFVNEFPYGTGFNKALLSIRIMALTSTHDKMAYHHTASAAMPAQPQPNQNAARTRRVNQVQFIEERLRNDISPAAVAGITAFLAQLETQPTLPSLAVSIVADVAADVQAYHDLSKWNMGWL